MPCALEAYVVLTRMPSPHRAGTAIVCDFLRQAFPPEHLALTPDGSSRIVERLVDAGVSGGASWDAMIADAHGHELATLDARARPTYERIGVAVRFLA